MIRGKEMWKLVALAAVAMALPANAAVDVGTTDTSDGALTVTEDTVIDLAEAADGAWDSASPAAGKGVYDKDKWAVVFKYSSVKIAAGKRISFKNHPAFAPVIWLVNGDVTINGTVDVASKASEAPEPGPGGFHGGWGPVSPYIYAKSPGPGGDVTAYVSAEAGAFGGGGTLFNTRTRAYGNSQLVPLIGGTGGAGNNYEDAFGMGGAGAILIAATGSLTLNGSIDARAYADVVSSPNYGGWPGSAGGIRLAAASIAGSGSAEAYSPLGGGVGRIRVEANSVSGALHFTPAIELFTPETPVLLWPRNTDPVVTIISVSGQAVPDDPHYHAAYTPETADVVLPSTGTKTVTIQTNNVPTEADGGKVELQVVPVYGPDRQYITAHHVSGTTAQSTWSAQVTLPDNRPVTMLARVVVE